MNRHGGLSVTRTLAAGLTGAVALNALHEGVRQLRGDAPRMDVVAKRAIRRAGQRVGLRPPRGRRLYATALAGDVLSNALYYAAALALGGRHRWTVAGLTGLLAGIGGLVLPPVVGLGHAPHDQRRTTRAMTIAWYVIGGLAAAAAAEALERRRRSRRG